MPLSDTLELTDRAETEERDDSVDTDRSSRGTALRASEGVTHGSGEDARAGGEAAEMSMAKDGRGVRREA